VWTVSSGVVYENAAAAGYSANVVELLYQNGVVYQENSSGGWWSWNGSTWVSASSPSGTAIPPASQIIDASGNVWTVSSGIVYENAAAAGYSANVVELLYQNSVVYQKNSSGGWWSWNGSTWVSASSPVDGNPNANLTVDLGAPTGKTLSPYLYGFSVGGLAFGFSHNNDFDSIFNAAVQVSAAAIQPQLVRMNTQQTLPMLQHIFANGASTPDWTYLDNWINNHSAFFDDATGRVIFGIGPCSSDMSIAPSTIAAWVAPLAQHFKDKGQEVFWWEIGNEDQGMGASAYLNYFNPISDALHAFNSAYKVGGPVVDYWDDSGFGAAVIQSVPSKLDFVNYHTYSFAGNATPTSDQIYAAATSGRPISDVTGARSTMRAAGISDSVPIGMTEYNMLLDGGNNATYQAALWAALYISTSYKSDPNFQMSALWDLGGNDYGGGFGAIGNAFLGQNYSVIDPQGYYLGYAGQHLGGTEVTSTTTLSKLDVISTVPSPGHFAIQLVNYDSQNDQTVSIAVNGGTASSVTLWELGKSSASTPTISTQVDLGNVAVPSEDIVILTGTLQ
jgi:hypothetical protein